MDPRVGPKGSGPSTPEDGVPPPRLSVTETVLPLRRGTSRDITRERSDRRGNRTAQTDPPNKETFVLMSLVKGMSFTVCGPRHSLTPRNAHPPTLPRLGTSQPCEEETNEGSETDQNKFHPPYGDTSFGCSQRKIRERFPSHTGKILEDATHVHTHNPLPLSQ